MPTVNPRINVTLSPSLFGMVDELAKHQRVSKSMVLRELLEASEPALAQVVAMLKAAESMTGQRAKVASGHGFDHHQHGGEEGSGPRPGCWNDR